jgi:acyl-coenzyme A thioesterase PaaI-like protein
VSDPLFVHEPDPDHPGWHRWDVTRRGLFNDLFGLKLCRSDGPGRARLRYFPTDMHRNALDGLHGGAFLAYLDIALFGAGMAMGIPNVLGGSTVEVSSQFIAPGRVNMPLDVDVELLRETGRMLFLRGLFLQEEAPLLSFSAILRKPGKPSA